MNIAPERTSYCYVVRPDQPKTMLPQHSKCAFPELYDASDANGKWNVISGIQGRTNEMNFEIDVAAVQTFGNVLLEIIDVVCFNAIEFVNVVAFFHLTAEELQTFVHVDTVARQMTMKCKLMNTEKVFQFCRFVRMIDEIGYNLVAGQGNEKYR